MTVFRAAAINGDLAFGLGLLLACVWVAAMVMP